MQHHTRCGSSAGLTVKRDEVTEFTPTADLGLTDKSSFLFDSLLFGPKRDKKNNISISTVLELEPEQVHQAYVPKPKGTGCS